MNFDAAEGKWGNMYKNYIFDLYGTLVDIHTDEEGTEIWEKLRLFYGYYGAVYTPDELKKAYKSLTEAKEKSNYGYEAYPEIQIDTVFSTLYSAKGVQADTSLVVHTGQFFRVLTTEYIRLYEGVTGMLQQLRCKGKKIYLLSNAQRIFTEYELRVLGISQYFDGILISSDYGVKKPDRRFFEILLEKYHLNPKECIMIGNDAKTDIAGAANMGMDTCYIHSNISPEYDIEVGATYVQMEMNIEKVCKILIEKEEQKESV